MPIYGQRRTIVHVAKQIEIKKNETKIHPYIKIGGKVFFILCNASENFAPLIFRISLKHYFWWKTPDNVQFTTTCFKSQLY